MADLHLLLWHLENITGEYLCYFDLGIQGLDFYKDKNSSKLVFRDALLRLLSDCFKEHLMVADFTFDSEFYFLFCEQKKLSLKKVITQVIVFMFQVSAIASEQWSVDFLPQCFPGETKQMKPDSKIRITYRILSYLSHLIGSF